MSTYLDKNTALEYFYENTGNQVIIDSNLLILILIGSVDINFIKKVKATKIFSKQDFYTLCNIIKRFKRFSTTPHILTEVSNFAGQTNETFKKEIFAKFTQLIVSSSFEEIHIDSPVIVKDNSFQRLGLTDTAIIELHKEKTGIITKDLNLCIELDKRNIPVLNFNYMMDFR